MINWLIINIIISWKKLIHKGYYYKKKKKKKKKTNHKVTNVLIYLIYLIILC